MGYDLYGKKPAAEKGKIFRMAFLSWPMLVNVIVKFAPKECRPCAEWYGENSYGRGFDGVQSDRLAAKLESLIAEGGIVEHIGEAQGKEGLPLSIDDLRT